MIYKVRPAFRKGAEFQFCTDAMKQIDSLVSSTGEPLVRDTIGADGPIKTILNYPATENENLTPTTTAGVFADDTLVGFFGNLKMYKAVQPTIAGVQTSSHRLFEKNKTLVKMITYLDGGCADSTAFAIAKIVG
jgi:HK97 family phage major capsid protein